MNREKKLKMLKMIDEGIDVREISKEMDFKLSVIEKELIKFAESSLRQKLGGEFKRYSKKMGYRKVIKRLLMYVIDFRKLEEKYIAETQCLNRDKIIRHYYKQIKPLVPFRLHYITLKNFWRYSNPDTISYRKKMIIYGALCVKNLEMYGYRSETIKHTILYLTERHNKIRYYRNRFLREYFGIV